ncbi:MAG TPA: regulator, partial [Rubricoccaceae bacterium]|nr:regulator [Rubricoccaceae bacterium]
MPGPTRVAMRCCLLVRLGGIVVLGSLLSAGAPVAQPGTWRAYPSLREVTALAASGEEVWVATTGGVYGYNPASGEVRRFTPVEGLFGTEARTMAFDAARNALWIGYAEGVLDRLDGATGAVTSFYDVARATQYAARGINRIAVRGDSLLLSTDFGLVVFDAGRGEVRASYTRLGPLAPATAVRAALVAPLPEGGLGLWLAADGGVVRAPLDGTVLEQPSAWTADPGSPLTGRALALYQGLVVAGTARDVYLRNESGSWERLFFTDDQVFDVIADGDRLFAQAPFYLHVWRRGAYGFVLDIRNAEAHRALTAGPGGTLWVGDLRQGLLEVP